MTRSPSLTVGTSPFGLSLRYSGSRLPPNGPPRSTRSNGMSSSAQHHSTFCTFDEVVRPQIFSIADLLRCGDGMEPQISGEWNRDGPACYIPPKLRVRSADGKRMKRRALVLSVLLLTPAAATASQQGVIAIKNWKAMDLCAKEAQIAFPDFTADANAKRDAKLKECLAGRNLPPRDPLAPGH